MVSQRLSRCVVVLQTVRGYLCFLELNLHNVDFFRTAEVPGKLSTGSGIINNEFKLDLFKLVVYCTRSYCRPRLDSAALSSNHKRFSCCWKRK